MEGLGAWLWNTLQTLSLDWPFPYGIGEQFSTFDEEAHSRGFVTRGYTVCPEHLPDLRGLDWKTLEPSVANDGLKVFSAPVPSWQRVTGVDEIGYDSM